MIGEEGELREREKEREGEREREREREGERGREREKECVKWSGRDIARRKCTQYIERGACSYVEKILL